MHYLALLIGREDDSVIPGTEEFARDLARYEEFEAMAGDSVAWGAALESVTAAVTIRHDAGTPLITDGPFAESAEVVGGVYVLEADDLDAALELVRQLPAAQDCAVELWPMIEWNVQDSSYTDRWLAFLREPASVAASAPGTPEWDAGAAEHQRFADAAGAAIRGGGALHPPATATTVRVRDGELLLTDGPYAETAEVVDGVYLLAAGSAEQASALGARIPVTGKGSVELRKLIDFEQ